MSKVYLTLGAIVKNEQHYVREWLAHYRAVGFEKFAVVLHGCTDDTEKQVRSLSFSDDITVGHVSGDRPQMKVYNELCREWKDKTLWMAFLDADAFQWMLDTYGKHTEWMLFTDADEFFFGTTENDVRTILERYDRFGGLAAHWHMFGASGRVQRPPLPSIKYFVERIPDDKYVLRGIKCAVQPRYVREVLSPHLFITSRPIVRENFEPVSVKGIWQCDGTPMWNVVRCNHYCTRSMEDWVARRKRGSCNDLRNADNYNVQHFFKYQLDRDMVVDLTIRRFVPELEIQLEV